MAGEVATEIDLAWPGTFVGSALFAKDYTFLIVQDKPQFTPEAFVKNPSTATGLDVIYRFPAVADKDGSASVNLDGKGKEIGAKLRSLRTPARVVLLGTMKNFPDKRQAVVTPVILIHGEPAIRLTPQDTKVSVGSKLTIKVQAQDLDAVQVHLEPSNPNLATLDKVQIAAKTDNIVLTAVGDGKVTFVAEGLVSGLVKTTEKIDIQIDGAQVLLPGIGFKQS